MRVDDFPHSPVTDRGGRAAHCATELRAIVQPWSNIADNVRRLAWRNQRSPGLVISPRPDRDIILAMTYVVVFSIVVQGLTIEKLVRSLIPR